MEVPCSIALSIYALQLIVTLPILMFLRNARDKALLQFRLPPFSLGRITILFSVFVAIIFPLILLNLWTCVAAFSMLLTLATLVVGIWLGR